MESRLLARPGGPLLARAAGLGLEARPLSLCALIRAARDCNLVHAHDARAHTLAAMAGGARLVVSRRVAFPIGSRMKYGRARHFIAVSRSVRGVLMAGGVPEEKISVVYDGVPLPPERREPGGARVVAPASADPRKGTALLLEAAARAGIPVHLSTDLESDLPTASIFVYLSHAEGLGSAVLLAMAAGVPVIASRVGGLPEAVTHGQDGWLVDNHPDAVALGQLAGNPELSRRLGERARRTVEARFTVERMLAGTLAVYRKVPA
jgi:glycosyltransferase involved in cell wall biosynthesis